jgi:hypothetical protein
MDMVRFSGPDDKLFLVIKGRLLGLLDKLPPRRKGSDISLHSHALFSGTTTEAGSDLDEEGELAFGVSNLPTTAEILLLLGGKTSWRGLATN